MSDRDISYASDIVILAARAIQIGNPSTKALAESVSKMDLPPDLAAAMIAELAFVVARFILRVSEPGTS